MAGGKPHGSNPRFRREQDQRAQVLDRAERIDARHDRRAGRIRIVGEPELHRAASDPDAGDLERTHCGIVYVPRHWPRDLARPPLPDCGACFD
jgi:hypothetical protein